MTHIDELLAEVDRLRAALGQIASIVLTAGERFDGDPVDGVRRLAEEFAACELALMDATAKECR
jgi:hypothetical protein